VSQFEFVIVLMSFVVAFAISEILAGWGRQFAQREHVKTSGLQLAASALLLLALIQALWGYWNFRELEWTLLRFLVAFLPLLVLSTAPFFITPHISGSGVTDAGEHYFRVRPLLFGIMGTYVLLNALTELVLSGAAPLGAQGIRMIAVALFVGLAVSRDPRIHWVGLTVLLILQGVFAWQVTPGLG
jgi:hypothetical protein